MEHVEQAQELLNRDPLPNDIEEQLQRLYKEASDEEKPYFADLFEALIVIKGG